jgi:serine/threonine-protein kinase
MKTIYKYIISLICFAILGLFLLDNVFLSIYVNKNKDIYLPDVRFIDSLIAEKQLKELGFEVEILFSDYNSENIPGNVIKISPRPFSKLKSGRIIKLTVASDKNDIILEDFTNISLRNAELILKRLDLKIDTLLYEYNNDIKKNHIISQFPKPSKLLKSNDLVTFIISQGQAPNYYVTPNLINLNIYKAKEKISRAGLILGNIKYEYSKDYLNNTVLEQDKTPGMKLSFPARINIIVSTDKK